MARVGSAAVVVGWMADVAVAMADPDASAEAAARSGHEAAARDDGP